VIVKRILASLFVIIGVVGVSALATGAYFQTTDTLNNYTFTTGSASLDFGFCPGINQDCSAVTPNLTTYTFSTASMTGPDQVGMACIVVKNTGPYLLHLTAKLTVTYQSTAGMQTAFQVYSQLTNSNCASPSGYAFIYPWQSAAQAQSAGNVPVGSLAPGASIYVLEENRWDSTNTNQNNLENQTLKLNTSLTGTTD
jgi:hypothetical protein